MKKKYSDKSQIINIYYLLRTCLGLFLCLMLSMPSYGQITIEAQGYGTDTSEAFPVSFTPVSATDLANSDQSSFLSISDVDTGGRVDTTERLFDGVAGAGWGFEAQFDTGSITINFNTTVNSTGYDITGVNTYAAWSAASGGRSDQEYTLTAIFVDNTIEIITSGTHYHNTTTEPSENGEVNVWTEVKIEDLSGVIAEGVKALRFDFLTDANAGGTVTYTEFDILGSPSASNDNFSFEHPGIGFTTDDLDAIKLNLNIEPWKTGYEELLASAQSDLNYVMLGPFAGVGRSENNGAYTSDMKAVHNMARLWYFTGNEAYAQKAHDILIAWATTQTEWLIGETYLTMGYEAFRIFEGADLLRGAWSGWTQNDTDILKTYFRNVWLDPLHLNIPGPLRSANQGMSQFAAAINIAVFLDDKDLFDELLYIFRTDASCGLLSSLSNGQVGDSGRDAHDQGQVMLWARSAETFWQQGVDVYSEYDNRILTATEYMSRANLRVDTPFIQHGTVYDVYPKYHYFDSPFGGSFQIETSMLNIVHSAYVTRLGMSSPYLEKYMTFATGEEASFTYLTPTDNSTAEPPRDLSGPADVASVTSLSSSDVGDASGGSTSYNNGTWTVNGRGSTFWNNSAPDYHFAYLPVDGDATIIAQLTSLSGGSPNDARAGLVFTENLTDNAAMASVFITSPEVLAEMYAFPRGDTAHSHPANSTRSYGRFSDNDDGLPPFPYWLKIERIGDRVTLYSSPDGANWSTSHVIDYAIGTTAYYGLAVSSNDNGSLATATFTNVRITGGDDGEAIKVPEAPHSIYASRADDEATLRWLESFEADTYKIWRSTQPGGPYTLITEQIGTSFIDTTINPCGQYYYAVSAVNTAGESSRSPEDSFLFVDTDWYEAEDYDAHSGIQTEGTRDDFGGINIGWIHDGDWTRYNDIKIISANPIFRVRAAAGYNDVTGDIEVRTGSPTGTLIGTVTPIDTGRTQFWATNETTLTVEPGIYDIFLVFTNGSGFNINWFDIVPTDTSLIAYSDSAFEGTSYEFVEGQYRASDGSFDNNAITSLKVSEGYEVELFQEDNFTGDSEVFQAGEVICLNDFSFNNVTTSLIVRETTLSIDKKDLTHFRLYPNPAKQNISLNQAMHSIKIVDLTGKVVKIIAKETEKINISDLASGIYILRGFSKEKILLTNKFIKE